MKRLLLLITIIFFTYQYTVAQNLFDAQGNRIDGYEKQKSHFVQDEDSTDEDMPSGMYVWRVDELLGDIIKANIDTMSHQFQNANLTEGITGRYNMLGNMGSPRISRSFMKRPIMNDFIFSDPFDFFIKQPGDFHFTNTLSPITNITYDECGDRTDGEDRIKAFFAINAGKDIGLGFKIDYLYGRGYYDNQATSEFNTTLYGSYLKDKYKAHLLLSTNHIKNGENGGIESDTYITDPGSLPNKYNSRDIPTMLNKAWNRVYVNTLFFTHRYNLGFYRTTDKDGNIVPPNDTISLDSAELAKLTPEQLDSLKKSDEEKRLYKTDFIPVTSINHSLCLDGNTRKFVNNAIKEGYYLDQYYDGDSINDKTNFLNVSNTLALQLHEGFNKWAQAGISLFGRHEFMHYKMPFSRFKYKTYNENRLTVGAKIQRSQGRFLNYSVIGSNSSTKDYYGQFNVDGKIDLTLPIKKDTIQIKLHSNFCRKIPSFYYRHYHSQTAWWDNNDLNNEFRARFEGELSYNRTRTNIKVSVENIKDYTYFATKQKLFSGSGNDAFYSNGVTAKQYSGSIQVLEATLNQNFKLGIFNWENELTYSTSSKKEVLPLPTFSAYSNLYLHFRIAKVLSVRLGSDVRYFTKYYAPTYSPLIGQYAIQDKINRIEIGEYPIVNVYANMHLKHTRFYLMATHVNKSSNGGHYFLVPHYPINPLTIKFGISWNFFN